jgi:hypothetical protein
MVDMLAVPREVGATATMLFVIETSTLVLSDCLKRSTGHDNDHVCRRAPGSAPHPRLPRSTTSPSTTQFALGLVLPSLAMLLEPPVT